MQENEIQKEKVSTPLLIANITLVGFVISFGFMIYETKHTPVMAVVQKKTVSLNAFTDLTLEAKSVFVWDVLHQKKIYGKDETTIRPLASITKIMTAVTALSILPANTTVTIKKEFLAEEGDSGLYVDEKWNFKNLLDLSLMASSNDGMRSIASVAGASLHPQNDYVVGRSDFIHTMNSLAQEIGLNTLHFNNETGLDDGNNQPGGLGSAEDVAKLMQYALIHYPHVMEATKDQSLVIYSLDKKHVAKNTDPVVSKIPNIIASKTGWTTLAGGNLVIAFDAGLGRPIIITILGSSYDGRFDDMEKLASSTLAYLRDNE